MSGFIKNIPGNGKFLYSAFNNYTNEDIIKFLEDQGVKTKIERGKRVFPVSDKSIDVLDAFLKRLKELKVEIRTEYKVEEILIEGEHVVGVACYATRAACHAATTLHISRQNNPCYRWS